MAGRPRTWHFFTRTQWAHDYQWHEDGRIRDRYRHELSDSHRLFSRHTRAETLAEEWLGPRPKYDCVWCGDRSKEGGKYTGKIKGGGPPYEIVHLNGNTRDCSRNNLKYAPPHPAKVRRHLDWHAEMEMRTTHAPPRPHGRMVATRDGDVVRRTRPVNARPKRLFALYSSDDGYDEPPSGRGSPFKLRSQSQLREASRFLTLLPRVIKIEE